MTAATKLVPEGKRAIGLSGGTTAAKMPWALHYRTDLTIITNPFSIGLETAEQGQDCVLITGGMLRFNSLEPVGPLAEATLRFVDVGTTLMGVDGLNPSGGLTIHDDIEACTNHMMTEWTRWVIAVADAPKIGRVTLARMMDLGETDVLVTDSNAPEGELARIRGLGVEVMIVSVPVDPKTVIGS